MATSVIFLVSGMRCANCAARLQSALSTLEGVSSAQVNLATSQAAIDSTGLLTPAALREAIEAQGFSAELKRQDAHGQQEQLRAREAQAAKKLASERRRVLGSAALTAPLLLTMLGMSTGQTWHLPMWLEWLLATPVQFYFGAHFYRGAWHALKNRSATMDVLVALGTSAAYGFSLYLWATQDQAAMGQLYFETSALVICLISLGKWLESRARARTQSALTALMALRPARANLWRQGRWQEVDVDRVLEGDRVLVRVGEKVPVDGTILAGQSELDESFLTGESLPVLRCIGDRVQSGAINHSSVIEVLTTAVGAQSSLNQIIALVERAQLSKAPLQQLVDKVCAWFVPVVLVIALITFSAWLAVGAPLAHALLCAVAVLVIACPCALGLATPAAIVTGTGVAARHGILIKEVDVLQKAHAISGVIFDKTGTLTQGAPVLVHWSGDTRSLQLAACLQQASEHPLAKALRAAATPLSHALPAPSDIQVHVGAGIRGRIGTELVAVGNRQLLSTLHLPQPPANTPPPGATEVWVVIAGQLAGYAWLRDELRAESVAAVANLRARRIKSWLVSGDAPAAVAYIGQQLQLDGAFDSVRPTGKVAKVAALKAEVPGLVAMVGDGVNDAPALAAADVGIAMGAGSAVALESAAITLLRSDPRLISDAIDISAATWRTIKQNLFWAFIFNGLGIPLAALGYLRPELAGAAMAFSSVLVLSNALRLKRWRPQASH
ncbi:MAG: heavy metal translocating P-type ATPase [Aeromonas sp.]